MAPRAFAPAERILIALLQFLFCSLVFSLQARSLSMESIADATTLERAAPGSLLQAVMTFWNDRITPVLARYGYRVQACQNSLQTAIGGMAVNVLAFEGTLRIRLLRSRA